MGRLGSTTPALLVLLLLLAASGESKYIRWLSLLHTSSSIISINRQEICDSLEGLSKRQVKICKRNIEVMDSVRQGARRAIQECQWQFRNRRWNCNTNNGTSVFGKVLNDGTREAAFVHAISAAGVAHAVTTACSSGQLIRCGCDHTVRGFDPRGFQWSGCSDNVAFGTAFSKSFVDSRDVRRARGRASPRALMNLHNNEAGRKVLQMKMRVECKCHGVSGSCEMKTCWKAMPSFREVGAILKDKFDGSTEVQAMTETGNKRHRLVPLNPHFKPPTSNDLIYLDSSPDFCERDDKTGALGTHGRPCNRSSKAIEGCELLCCGRGYNTRTELVRERCRCKFHWCCYVKCSECERNIEINTCF